MKPLIAAALAAATFAPLAAHAVDIYASSTDSIFRGTVPGDFPGQYYGGNLLGAFPVVLTEAQARSAVIGAPDNTFLTLPGGPPTPGAAFSGAYVEVNFGANFDTGNILKIWELGDNGESAQIFLWANNGGNVQIPITRGVSDLIEIDLAGYAGALAGIGGTAFTKVGIGGRDVLGASQGFDLDAVAIQRRVPEPASGLLVLAAMGLAGWMTRRQRVK